MSIRSLRCAAASALVAGVLSVMLGPTAVDGAVEPSAEIRITFKGACAGTGHWWLWDTLLYPDPTGAPGYSESDEFAIAWGADAPVRVTTIIGSPLEPQRVAYRITDAAGAEVLREFLSVVGEQFVLDLTVDCSTIPYTIVALGDTAMAVPTSAPVGPPTVIITGIGCLIGSLALALRRRRGTRPTRRAG
ncbi:MAG: hypothetical protein IT341_07555 [Chloroflexi bacterium]|nr:hypothetical protein [Chloroflexota bacterium]